jgi:hypothetical protein
MLAADEMILGEIMPAKILLLAAALLGMLALAGCETMSAEQCAVADWRALGYQDGNRNGASRFSDRAESCAERGISADAGQYQDGFSQGLREFCRPERGFSLALRGGSFGGGCPADLRNDFASAYADGRRAWAIQSDINAARNTVMQAENRRREIDSDLNDRERRLREATTDEERRSLRAEIDRLRESRRDNNQDLRIAQERQLGLEQLMNDLRYEIGQRWGPW